MSGNTNSFGEPVDHDGEVLEYGVMGGHVAPFAVSSEVFHEFFSGSETFDGAHLESGPLDEIPVQKSSSGGIPLGERVEIEDITNVVSEDEAHSPRAVQDLCHNNTSSTIHAVLRTSKHERDELLRARQKLNNVLNFMRKKGFSEKQMLEEMNLSGSGPVLMERDEFGLPLTRKMDDTSKAHKVFDDLTQQKGEASSFANPFVDKMKSKVDCTIDAETKDLGKPNVLSEETKSTTWANVLKADIPPAVSFKYFPLEKGTTFVQPPDEVLKQGNEKFKNCVVGTFSKGTHTFKVVSDFAFQVWKSRGLQSVFQKDSSTFVFRFSSEAGVNEVLSRGTWYISRRPLIVTAWGHKPGSTTITSMPLWCKFSQVPDCYWTEEGLSRLASVIGEPIGADALTSKMELLPFAKMQVSTRWVTLSLMRFKRLSLTL